MNQFNWKGITAEAVTGVIILAIALINAILQMCGFNTLPIEDKEISVIVSGAFLVGAALYNTWKNRNATTYAQEAQQVLDALRRGTIVVEDVQKLISKVKD